MKNTDTHAQWNKLYSDFESSLRNTETWSKKAHYAKRILQKFSGKIPLSEIVDGARRQEICQELFSKDDDVNYVVYPLCMGCHLRALMVSGNFLVKGDVGFGLK